MFSLNLSFIRLFVQSFILLLISKHFGHCKSLERSNNEIFGKRNAL